MSSLVRRIQKKIMKKQGFYRDKEGNILQSNGEIVCPSWHVPNDVRVAQARWPSLLKKEEVSA